MQSSVNCTMEGSPPRMRGKGTQFLSNLRCVGITPACAGKSLVRELLLIVSRDHPRVCGEKPMPHSFVNHSTGSPPRMRGKVPGLCKNLE